MSLNDSNATNVGTAGSLLVATDKAISILNSNFANNTAGSIGGAIYATNSGLNSPITISGVNIDNADAGSGTAGGIYVMAANVMLHLKIQALLTLKL